MAVDGNRQNVAAAVEGVLHAVAVVHIQVQKRHAAAGGRQRQDGENNVVDVAEPRGVIRSGVVVAARRVEGGPGLAAQEQAGRGHRGVDGAVCHRVTEVPMN